MCRKPCFCNFFLIERLFLKKLYNKRRTPPQQETISSCNTPCSVDFSLPLVPALYCQHCVLLGKFQPMTIQSFPFSSSRPFLFKKKQKQKRSPLAHRPLHITLGTVTKTLENYHSTLESRWTFYSFRDADRAQIAEIREQVLLSASCSRVG